MCEKKKKEEEEATHILKSFEARVSPRRRGKKDKKEKEE